jgi:hypothetical protein
MPLPALKWAKSAWKITWTQALSSPHLSARFPRLPSWVTLVLVIAWGPPRFPDRCQASCYAQVGQDWRWQVSAVWFTWFPLSWSYSLRQWLAVSCANAFPIFLGTLLSLDYAVRSQQLAWLHSAPPGRSITAQGQLGLRYLSARAVPVPLPSNGRL